MFNEKGVKEAFERVKLDIFNLTNELSQTRQEISNIQRELQDLIESFNAFRLNFLINSVPTHTPTDTSQNQTNPVNPTHTPTVPLEVKGLKYPNFELSMRNVGVPTDRQTDQQTVQQTDLPTEIEVEQSIINQNYLSQTSVSSGVDYPPKFSSNAKNSFSKASEILDSLDVLKKEIRLKFKGITQQEMLVFSSIYQLEERFSEGVEYRQIAIKLGLSESSIRDYVQKIISKGIPILKTRLNNKKILLSISPELKKVATLDTLIRLREI
jgi:hypothetical protein